MAGLFAAGAAPTGSADPFGLRRAALGIVNALLATQTDFSVAEGLAEAAALQPVPVSEESLAETAQFVARRLQGVLAEAGYAFDVVEAVLAARGENPYAAQQACNALAALVSEPWGTDAFTAYARCARITRGLNRMLELNPAAYQEDVERRLHAAYAAAASAVQGADEPADALGEALRSLQEPINAFFDAVLVNAEDETLRAARLALVQHIAALAWSVADLSKLQGF